MTDFEKKVYSYVLTIPAGRVLTYKQVAEALGRPRAFRAIGNALNKNPNLIQVPCHRVVRSDGEIGGYAGGRAQKKRLLKKEGVIIVRNRIKEI